MKPLKLIKNLCFLRVYIVTHTETKLWPQGMMGAQTALSQQLKGNDQSPRGEYINTAEAPPSYSPPINTSTTTIRLSSSPQRGSACQLIHLSLTRFRQHKLSAVGLMQMGPF